MTSRPDIAYYYPAPYWATAEGGWVKSLLLFFDQVAILLPNYMYGRHTSADPSLVEPLEDQGLLQILEARRRNPDWGPRRLVHEASRVGPRHIIDP